MSRLLAVCGLMLAIVIAPSDSRLAIASTTALGGTDVVVHSSEPAPATPVEHAMDPLPFWPAPDPFQGVDAPEPSAPADSSASPAPPAAEPVAEPAPPGWTAGPPALTTNAVISAASVLLGVPYLWGGNTTAGMDCSAYVSRAWGISRQTTDTLHLFATPIAKEDLLPGDAMNLTRAEDPRGYGHVRLFAAWANAEHSRVWVYEETPRQSIYHAISYDPRYTPMRRANLETDGVTAPLVAAPVEPARRSDAVARTTGARPSSTGAQATPAAPADRMPTRRAAVNEDRAGTFSTPQATVRSRSWLPAVTAAVAAPTPRPTPVPTPRSTPTPTPRPIRTPAPTVTPSATASPRASSRSRPAAIPTATATPTPQATVTPSPASPREDGRNRSRRRR